MPGQRGPCTPAPMTEGHWGHRLARVAVAITSGSPAPALAPHSRTQQVSPGPHTGLLAGGQTTHFCLEGACSEPRAQGRVVPLPPRTVQPPHDRIRRPWVSVVTCPFWHLLLSDLFKGEHIPTAGNSVTQR